MNNSNNNKRKILIDRILKKSQSKKKKKKFLNISLQYIFKNNKIEEMYCQEIRMILQINYPNKKLVCMIKN